MKHQTIINLFLLFTLVAMLLLVRYIITANDKLKTFKNNETMTSYNIQKTNFPAKYLGEFNFTHYTHTGNRTAIGAYPREGRTIAVDPTIIPLHSVVYIADLGYFVAEDTGGLIKGNKIDIFVDSKDKAIQLGTLSNKKLQVWIMKEG